MRSSVGSPNLESQKQKNQPQNTVAYVLKYGSGTTDRASVLRIIKTKEM